MKVKIYKPAKTAMQSGRARTGKWVLEYIDDADRGPEPLMGWTASGSTLNQVRLNFPTKEDAVRFAEAKGWDYDLESMRERKIRPRNYADNFRYEPPEE